MSSTSAPGLLQYWTETYWDERGDPRIKDWPLMSSMRPLLVILLLYALFVKVIGPLVMSKREAYSLKPILITYNLVMSLLNGYFFLRFLSLYDFGFGVFNVVQPPFTPLSSAGDLVNTRIEVAYFYELSKVVDLLDTIFFVLRKKQSQVGETFFRVMFYDDSNFIFRLLGSIFIIILGEITVLPFKDCFIINFNIFYFSVPIIGWLYIRLSVSLVKKNLN